MDTHIKVDRTVSVVVGKETLVARMQSMDVEPRQPWDRVARNLLNPFEDEDEGRERISTVRLSLIANVGEKGMVELARAMHNFPEMEE